MFKKIIFALLIVVMLVGCADTKIQDVTLKVKQNTYTITLLSGRFETITTVNGGCEYKGIQTEYVAIECYSMDLNHNKTQDIVKVVTSFDLTKSEDVLLDAKGNITK